MPKPAKSKREIAARRALARDFARKVRLNRLALFAERLLEALVWPAVVVIAFLVVSLLQLWQFTPPLFHRIGLGAFALALLVSFVSLLRLRMPSREEAIRRLERNAGIRHRPASSYEDRLFTSASPETTTLWEAHRKRLASLIRRLKPTWPAPRTDRRDPYAVRAGLLLLLVVALIIAGPNAATRLRAAFNPGTTIAHATLRLDAWVTPPFYTNTAPVILSDGKNNLGSDNADFRALSVPERSELVVRAHAPKGEAVALTFAAASGVQPKPVKPQSAANGLTQFKLPLLPADQAAAEAASLKDEAAGKTDQGPDVIAHVTIDGSVVASWRFRLIMDHPPQISLVGKPRSTPQDALRLTFKASDDYGVDSAQAHFALADSKAAAGITAPGVKPLFPPPVMNLPLDQADAKSVSGHATQDLTAHPWAGLRVNMTLVAKDQAGQTGKSQIYSFVLPERHFTKPLARALIEQRKKLVRDPRDIAPVARALNALTLGGPQVIKDPDVYLNLRTCYWRLKDDDSRPAAKSVVNQLWQVALRIEYGNLPSAEGALQAAQEALRQALKNGASPQEINRLVNNLREALNKYLRSVTQQAQQQGGSQGQQQNQQNAQTKMQSGNRSVSQQDLEKMLNDIQRMAQSGSNQLAQKMLSHLQDVLSQLQAKKFTQNPRTQQMQQALQNLDKLINRQQKLLDKTFQANRNGQGRQRFAVRPSAPSMPWAGTNFPQMFGMPQQPNQGSAGQQRAGQSGQSQSAQGQGSQGRGSKGQGSQAQRQAAQALAREQQSLMQQLQQLMQKMNKAGGQSPGALSQAGRSMRQAQQALHGNNLHNAAQQQGDALSNMRQGAQSMAQQIAKAQGGSNSHGEGMDPLGRPTRTQGPELGLSVKVPDRINVQRARQVLDELRQRLSDPSRPMIELDYLERLIHAY